MKVIVLAGLLLIAMQSVNSQDLDDFDLKKLKSISVIQRNSLSLDYKFLYLTLLYERTIPVFNSSALLLGAGISQGVMSNTNDRIPVYKAAFMVGRLIHFAEAGVAIVPMHQDINLLNPFIGYRFQSYSGFFFRIDLLFVTNQELDFVTDASRMILLPTPGISIGYSF